LPQLNKLLGKYRKNDQCDCMLL